MITCIMGALRPDATVNDGAYNALVGMQKCDAECARLRRRRRWRQSSTFATATVNSTRTSNADPMRARIWLDDPESEGAAIFVNMSATAAPTAHQSVRHLPRRLLRQHGRHAGLHLQRLPRRHRLGRRVLRARTRRRRRRHQGAAHDRDQHDQRQRQSAHGRRQQRQQLEHVLVRVQRGLLPPQRRRWRPVLRARRARSGHGHVGVALRPLRLRPPARASNATPAFRSSTRTRARSTRVTSATTACRCRRPRNRLLANGDTVEKVDYWQRQRADAHAVHGGQGRRQTHEVHAPHAHAARIDQIKFYTFVGNEAAGMSSPARSTNTQYELYWDEAAGDFKVTGQMMCGNNGCSTQALQAPCRAFSPSFWSRAAASRAIRSSSAARCSSICRVWARPWTRPPCRSSYRSHGPGLSVRTAGDAALRARLPDGGVDGRVLLARFAGSVAVRRQLGQQLPADAGGESSSATRAMPPTRCCSTAPRRRSC